MAEIKNAREDQYVAGPSYVPIINIDMTGVTLTEAGHFAGTWSNDGYSKAKQIINAVKQKALIVLTGLAYGGSVIPMPIPVLSINAPTGTINFRFFINIGNSGLRCINVGMSTVSYGVNYTEKTYTPD